MSLSFLLIRAAPGGPDALLAQNNRITKQQIEAIRESYGLNKPIYEQYFIWMGKVITFDFGKSYTSPKPALAEIGERVGPTVLLGTASYLFGLLGIPLGIYAARHRGRLGDNIIRVLTVLGSSMPAWWFALMLILILASTIRWFPQGFNTSSPWAFLLHLLIPAFLLSTSLIVTFTRFVRAETLEVLGQDYVRTANAKGLSAQRVSRWHVFRNSLTPIVTLFGYFLPAVLSGAIISERIFNWPGLGQLFFKAANSRDMPVLLALLFIGTVATLIGTLLADIGYAVVDPRVRYK